MKFAPKVTTTITMASSVIINPEVMRKILISHEPFHISIGLIGAH